LSAPFHFKQFSIVQDITPMKVGTDGVLLGAWVDVDHKTNILDIGTGTGLIALMLAQRAPNANIVAIDSHTDALIEAGKNFQASRYTDRITAIASDVKDFQPLYPFDLIVSNPPFFKSSLHAPSQGRTMARHDIGFSAEDFARTARWLSPDGVLAGIYPIDIYQHFHELMQASGMRLIAKCLVQATPAKPAHRVLFAFAKDKGINTGSAVENIIIETDGRHQYSDSYSNLTKDFYLGF
jgi:tRNA1Val (adenine37-N6)-methyltransferase